MVPNHMSLFVKVHSLGNWPAWMRPNLIMEFRLHNHNAHAGDCLKGVRPHGQSAWTAH